MHIVVVDQSRTVLKAVSRLLEAGGHFATPFTDGVVALDFIKSTRSVDALITSTELNAISGLELCWETRLLTGRDRAIYIILMSSNVDQKALINALDSGADEFIRKPPVDEELYARLRSAARQLGLQRELIRMAMTDPLTGLLNRRAFFENIKVQSASGDFERYPVAIMFDVDHFKRVNDTYGHDVGDQVLRAIGGEVQNAGAVAGRLGGEEFAAFLVQSSVDEGSRFAEQLRTKFSSLSFETPQGPMSITCSFGVAEAERNESVDQLLKRADNALYGAKNGGRNRVVAAQKSNGDASDKQWSQLLRSDSRPAPLDDDKPKQANDQENTLVRWPSDVEENMLPQPSNNDGAQPVMGRAFVLDDEAQIGAVVCKVLEACSIAPRQFTSPEPFLAELKEAPPSLVVLDLSLGQSDAVEVIHSLEKVKFRGKVLLISGRDEATLNEITHIGERHGLAMLPPLKKPFRAADIRQRLAIHVQETGKNPAQPKPDKAAQNDAKILLVEAMRNHWLELWYQPKISLKTAEVCGAEALVRARHPFQGVLTPDRLLPPAGDAEYLPLTKFVIERAMADWSRFEQRVMPLRLSVNAPVSAIHSPTFISQIRAALPQTRNFNGFTIEVTEDEVIRDSEWAREIANQLRLYNIDLSIDDFGSAYASLSRLNELPFSEVKIDQQFVMGCASDKLKYSLCQTVVDLAHRFGATACAEGVETLEDLRAVMAMKCDTAQGFLFAKPMPVSEFTAEALTRGIRTVRGLLIASTGAVNKSAASA